MAQSARTPWRERRVNEDLGTDALARLHGLTLANPRVLKLLRAG